MLKNSKLFKNRIKNNHSIDSSTQGKTKTTKNI